MTESDSAAAQRAATHTSNTVCDASMVRGVTIDCLAGYIAVHRMHRAPCVGSVGVCYAVQTQLVRTHSLGN
jgi:hypothetical protein